MKIQFQKLASVFLIVLAAVAGDPAPSSQPSISPSSSPSQQPSSKPSSQPLQNPTSAPSYKAETWGEVLY